MEVDLRTIECAVAFVYCVFDMVFFQSIAQTVCSDFPIFIGTHAVFRSCGQFDMIFEAELFVNAVDQADNATDFVFDLFRCHEDMSIVLVEATNTHQTVQSTGFFMSVYQTDFTHTDRQISVGMHILFVNQHAAGAVHRFDCIVFIIDNCCIHVIFVVFPVTASVPQVSVQDQRCRNFYIACFFMDLSPVIQQCIFQYHTIRQEEGETRTFFKHCEQFQFFAQFSVVTFFGFFHHCQVSFQFGCLRISCTIDTGQHFVLFAASPVSACYGCQFDCFYGFCAHQVRTCTQICEVTLFVEGNHCIFRQILNQFYFVGFFSFFHVFDCFCTRQFKAFDRQIFFYNLLHFSFDGFQFFRCESFFFIEVIVETVCNCRTDCQFYFRVQSFYSLCQNMRCCMTESDFTSFVFKCADAYFRIFVYYITQIFYFAVNDTCTSVSCQTFADGFCDIQNGHCAVKFFYYIVFQCNLHIQSLLLHVIFCFGKCDFFAIKKSRPLSFRKRDESYNLPRFHPYCLENHSF